MKALIDSHILIWHAFGELGIKAPKAQAIIKDFNHELYFSSVSVWEVVIKSSLNKPNFNIDAKQLTHGLLQDGFKQLKIENHHLYEIKNLPNIHKDPFDRLLLAQAKTEHMRFLTADQLILKYADDVLIDVTV